ncbi:MAG: DNA polymerase III subunit delta [Bacteroidales bacterium]|nr:DNA polymerase III subunit delta [Bacteroidales bacterium]
MQTYDKIMKDLKNKVYHPLYFLSGEEPFFIDQITDYISDNVLDGTEKEFNHTVLYGIETNEKSIVEIAKRFPMMANYQVLIIKEAQHLKKIEENLLGYIQNPLKSTILVICYKYHTLDKRKTFAKTVDKMGVLFESGKIGDWDIPKWTAEYLKLQNYTITNQANILLTEHLGNDLSKIAGEINKLKLNIPENTQITGDHIEEFIGISKDYNVFELQKAIATKNDLKANRIVNHFNANQKENPFAVIMYNLYLFFSRTLIYHDIKDTKVSNNEVASILKVKPFFVRDYEVAAKTFSRQKLFKIMSLLREYDVRSKGVDNATIQSSELLKEMVYRIMN